MLHDRVLKFYDGVLGINETHFGIWEPEDEPTLDNMRVASRRYTSRLINAIPSNVQSVLDAGCGYGGISRSLKEHGFEVVALSPDVFQQQRFKEEHPDIPFFLSRFEDFSSERSYDLVLFSESGQYMDLDAGVYNCSELLQPGGYVLAIDYFLLPSEEDSVIRNSGHLLDAYLQTMNNNGFTLLSEEDISEAAAPTLSFIRSYLQTTGTDDSLRNLTQEILVPGGSNSERAIFGEIEKAEIFDAEKFLEHKKYLILLFQKKK